MSNSWWEIQVLCNPDLEDSVFWRLERFGCRGTAREIKDKSFLIKAYLPHVQAESLDLAALSLWLSQDAFVLQLSQPKVKWHLINEEDWANSWKQYWHPQEIGDRFLIYPAWLDPPVNSDRIILRLDPGSAFGTGLHPTTQLSLESIEMRFSAPNVYYRIADIGCGSGILSLGAILLGAKKVYAVDIDPLAVKATRLNANLNNISSENLVVEQGSINELKSFAENGFDGIVCNILAEVILDLIPQTISMVKPQSWAIFSGILLDQAGDVADALESNGWIIAALWKRKEWCCFNVRRS